MAKLCNISMSYTRTGHNNGMRQLSRGWSGERSLSLLFHFPTLMYQSMSPSSPRNLWSRAEGGNYSFRRPWNLTVVVSFHRQPSHRCVIKLAQRTFCYCQPSHRCVMMLTQRTFCHCFSMIFYNFTFSATDDISNVFHVSSLCFLT